VDIPVDLAWHKRKDLKNKKQTWTKWPKDENYVPSTSTTIGEIRVPANMSEEEREREVLRQIEERLAAMPVENDRILVGYDPYSWWYLADDWQQYVTMHHEDVGTDAQGDVVAKATMNRPLKNVPWLFPDFFRPGELLPEATDKDSAGLCVLRQLRVLLPQRDVEELLDEAWAALADDEDEDPFATESGARLAWREEGVTPNMVVEVCRRSGRAVYVLFAGSKIHSYVPEEPEESSSPIVLTVMGDHAYFYRSGGSAKRVASRMPVTEPFVKPPEAIPAMAPWRRRKLESPPDCREIWADCLTFDEALTPCRCAPAEMPRIRAQLHRLGVVPKVKLSSLTKIASMTVPMWDGGSVKIAAYDPSLEEPCLQFCRAFSSSVAESEECLSWDGETMGQLAGEALLRLLRGARRPLRDFHGGSCAMCGDPVAEVDHAIPLGAGGSDDPDNLQGLCGECHRLKSTDSSVCLLSRDHPLMSRLNKDTYERFHCAASPPQIVADLHQKAEKGGGKVFLADVKRCRFSAFQQWPEDFPVYGPQDEILPSGTQQLLGGVVKQQHPPSYKLSYYNWVGEVPVPNPAKALPYFGAGWYTRESCKFLLDAKIITHDDILLTWEPSRLFPRAKLAEALQSIDDMWREAAGSGKRPLNELFGLWNRKRPVRYEVSTLAEDGDLLRSGKVLTKPAPGSNGLLRDYISVVELRTLQSMRPVHQVCLEHERLQVARALRAAEQSLGSLKRCLSIRVDGLYIQAPQKKLSFDPQVYRLEEAPDYEPTGGKLQIRHGAFPESTTPAWSEPLVEEEDDGFRDRLVERLATTKESALILGGPGVGKTHKVLRPLIAKLRAQGEPVVCLAFTHVAAQNLDPKAETLHSFLHRRAVSGSFRRGTVVIDEISQIDPTVAACLEHLRLSDEVRFVLAGDFDQCAPIEPHWKGAPVDPRFLKDSPLLRRWCGGLVFELTRCVRSDPAFFAWYRGLLQKPLREAVLGARKAFPVRGDASWHICLSHAKRRGINGTVQRRLLDKGLPKVRLDSGLEICEGTRLIFVNNKHPLYKNGKVVVVTSVADDGIAFDGGSLSLVEASACTDLAWAVTAASCQGKTMRGVVRLHDTDSPHFTTTLFYVAASRATGREWLQVV